MNVMTSHDGSKPWEKPAFQIFMRNARVFKSIDGKEEPASPQDIALASSLLGTKLEVICYENRKLVFCTAGGRNDEVKAAKKLVVKFYMLTCFPGFQLEDGTVEEMFTVGKYDEWVGEDFEPVDGFSQYDVGSSTGPLRALEFPLPKQVRSSKRSQDETSDGKQAKVARRLI